MRPSFLSLIILLLSLVACRSPEVDLEALAIVPDPYAAEDGSCPDGFRLVANELLATGPRCLPASPSQVVALESFEVLMALDVPPAATLSQFVDNHALYFPPLAGTTAGVDGIDGRGTPSAERLLEVNPDLIIGSAQRWGAEYDTLASIAPTVLYNFEHSGLWQDVAALVADVTGQQEAFDAQTAAYEARLTQLQQDLAEADKVVSVVRILPNAIRLYTLDSFAGEVIDSAGLDRPPSQQYTNAEMLAEFGQTTFYNISEENIEMADGDVIFLWTSSGSAEISERVDDRLNELREDQLWGTLEAVQDGRVHEVGGYWIGSSFIAAHYMIDDLYQYVLETEPATENPFR
ncbi:MAG: iron-siderophore ABC transporter substrate-binding protein [Chloroflexota bacterium]